MNRLLFTILTKMLIGGIALSCSVNKEETRQPNILFIMSDDHALLSFQHLYPFFKRFGLSFQDILSVLPSC
jgi:hypothetical protein